MAARLQFWFDFASTYSYLTAMRIEEAARNRSVSVDWKPFLLGPIFSKHGWNTSPFVVYPAKGRYMLRDMERLANARGFTFTLPKVMPAHSVLAARVALIGLEESWGVDFCRDVFVAEFRDGRDISDRSLIASLLDDLGQSSDAVFERALSEANKTALKEQTAEAERLQIFGAPSLVTEDGELFWGDDRLDMALDHACTLSR